MFARFSPNDKAVLRRIAVTFSAATCLLVLRFLLRIDPEHNLTIFNLRDPLYTENLLLLIGFFLTYLYIGRDVLKNALHDLVHGLIFNENFLMSIATIGAFLIGEYTEAVAVMLFYQVGEFFQSYAVNQSRKSIADLMQIAPDYANILENGKLVQVDPYEIKIHDQIIILAGEKIPLDGVVIEGSSTLDTAALTGESMPVYVEKGDPVISGSVNGSGRLIVEVSKEFEDSTVSRILDLVENATDKKADLEVFSTKFARYYTPVVVLSALALVLIPVLFLGQDFAFWLNKALIFLVVSCPCALVVSIPLVYFCGIGVSSKKGVLVKGSNYLEYLANVKTIIFDKTGTLTRGKFSVQDIIALNGNKEDLLKKAAYAEFYSNHPIAKSVIKEYDQELNPDLIGQAEEIPGKGMKILLDGKRILAGNRKLLAQYQIACPEIKANGTIIYIAEEEQYSGYLLIADKLKDDAVKSLQILREMGISEQIMLTGDREAIAAGTAEQLGINQYLSGLLPDQKFEQLEKLLSEKENENQLIAFVGDGVNDAPALALADVGIAMGGLGSDAAIESADIVLLNDQLSGIIEAIKISKKTLAIAKQNIVLSLFVKIAILILASFGFADLWLAVFGDVGVTILAVFNALRVFRMT